MERINESEGTSAERGNALNTTGSWITMTRRFRRALVWAHRWVGITVGLVFVIVSLSGSLLLFQPAFFEWAHGELIPDDLDSRVASVDRWVENARAAVPGLRGPVAIWAPHVEHNASDAGMLVFEGLQPGGLGNMGFAGVLVDPANGNVLGVIDIDHSPAYVPLFLHRDLWAGQTGQAVSGIMAIGTLVLLVAGLYLWWPARSQVWRKLSMRQWRATFTRARPLHDWLGVWTFPILIVLTASGLYLVRPAWVAPVLETLPSAPEIPPPVTEACDAPIGFDTAIARARALAGPGMLRAVYPADVEYRRWEMTFAGSNSDAMHRETHVIADLHCGAVAIEATPAGRPPREAAELWLVGLHDGTAFGLGGRILVSMAGFVPLVLMWSGIRMWLRRRGWLTARARRPDLTFKPGLANEAMPSSD